MKDTYHQIKKDILKINASLSTLINDIQNKSDISDERFDDWHVACQDIRNQIAEEVVRVAVIGPVKSGKSTLINSLFKNDYLKRGAGIMTSIVTRIRSGNHLKAALFFKSWDEINADIEQSLVMLPTWERPTDNKAFDIRRDLDRKSLSVALDKLTDDLLITDGVRNTSTVLLSLYLKGFEEIHDTISTGSVTAEFRNKKFGEHQRFVGNDELAVYLKDIELAINSNTMDHSIEIADCQGSDSPNPLHLAMIQDYLLKTHFIVYVISSRIGLRQADVRFLSIIKKMGILDNILFVVNVDLSEHESVEDLNSLVNKVKEELSILRPDPDVFCFSALFNLFRSSKVSLTKKDSARLAHWIEEEELITLSNSESQRFHTSLSEKLTRERFQILLRNHLERMSVIVTGTIRWVSMNRELMDKDRNGASAIISRIGQHQQRMIQMKSLIKNTLIGAKDNIMKELKTDINRFFNVQSTGMINQTQTFVKEYSVSIEKYRAKLKASGFSNTLYLVFQDFKRSLDTFITETIDPEIARYVREIEERIEDSLNSVAQPYYSMAADDIAELTESIGETTGKPDLARRKRSVFFDIDTVKQFSGLSLPSSSTALRYSPKIRTEAIVRLGFYSLTKLFKKFLKKSPAKEKEDQMRALSDGIEIIKSETEATLFFHFENYRENFKFQYVAKLLDSAEEYLYKILIERFQSYNANIKALEKIIQKKGSEREFIIKSLDQISSNAHKLHEEIDTAREKISQE